MSENGIREMRVKFFNKTKNFGFFDAEGHRDVYVAGSTVAWSGFQTKDLKEGVPAVIKVRTRYPERISCYKILSL